MTRVNYYLYEKTYDKKPRGKQTWAFIPGDGAGHPYSASEIAYALSMTFTQAKKWAKEHFSGYAEVYVLPLPRNKS